MMSMTGSASGAKGPDAAVWRIDGGEVTVETAAYRARFSGAGLVELTNLVTGESYLEDARVARRTSVAATWGERLYEDASVTVKKTEDGVEILLMRPDESEAGRGIRLSVDALTGDLLIRHWGRVDRPGLTALRWGLHVDTSKADVIIPGRSNGFALRAGDDWPSTFVELPWPMSWHAAVVIVQGELGGFRIWADDDDFHMKSLWVLANPDRHVLRFENKARPPFAQNQEYEAPMWRLSVHSGDWREAARAYKEWSREKYRPSEEVAESVIPWVDRIQTVVIVPPDTAYLDGLARLLDPRETMLYLEHWRHYGYDRMWPDMTPMQGLDRFVREAHERGFKVMFHVNYWGIDPLHPEHERFKDILMQDPYDGSLKAWTWPLDPPIYFNYGNPASKAWRDYLVRQFVELHEKIPFDALHLDQLLEVYDDGNGLIDGNSVAQGQRLLLEELRRALPGVALGGEGVHELSAPYIDFAQRTIWGFDWEAGTWNETMMEQIHPVDGFLFADAVKLWAHKAVMNPAKGGAVERLWSKAQDIFGRTGVLPTWYLLGMSPSLFERMDPWNELTVEIARLFQRYDLVPAESCGHPVQGFDVRWTLAGRNEGGVCAYYGYDGGFRGYVVADASGNVLSQLGFVEGVHRQSIRADGSGIRGWIGWESGVGRAAIGLDPGVRYTVLPVAKGDDPAVVVEKLDPLGVVLEGIQVSSKAVATEDGVRFITSRSLPVRSAGDFEMIVRTRHELVGGDGFESLEIEDISDGAAQERRYRARGKGSGLLQFQEEVK